MRSPSALSRLTRHTRQSPLAREPDGKPNSYEEVIHPEDRAEVLSKLDEATRTGKFDERFRITLPNGNIRWVRVQGFPVRNVAGKIWRLGGTTQDITDQKEAEDQVARNLEIAEAVEPKPKPKPKPCAKQLLLSPKISRWTRHGGTAALA